MGQAKQRGTHADRVKQACDRTAAVSAAKREAEESKRIDVGAGRAIVVSGGRDRLRNRDLITAALIAALGPLR